MLHPRNRLIYPYGIRPGFNPNHIASSLVRISGVVLSVANTTAGGAGKPTPMWAIYPKLVQCTQNNNTRTNGIDGIVGPYVIAGQFTRMSWQDAADAATVPVTDDKKGTMACIVRFRSSLNPNAASFYETMSNQVGNDGGVTMITGNTGAFGTNA